MSHCGFPTGCSGEGVGGLFRCECSFFVRGGFVSGVCFVIVCSASLLLLVPGQGCASY